MLSIYYKDKEFLIPLKLLSFEDSEPLKKYHFLFQNAN